MVCTMASSMARPLPCPWLADEDHHPERVPPVKAPGRDRCVLLVEADPVARTRVADLLRTLGYQAVLAGSADEAAAALKRARFQLSLVATTLNGADGLDLLRRLPELGADPGPIIMLTSPQDLGRAAAATQLGADDVLPTPVDPDTLESTLKDALARPRRAWGPTPAAPPAPEESAATARLCREIALWRSPAMRELWRTTQQAARVDVTVLIGGETGTGKDLVARGIHHFSSRRDQPFVKVNCAAVPRELLESELFGHEKGAFTGAHQQAIGKFEAADRGTIFLDEIGDLHPALQAKLLHVLQDGTFSRVGGKAVLRVDVRVLAASNQDLEQAVTHGRFREDLYYRLNVIQLTVPALRDRMEEVPGLAAYFTERYARLFNREGFALSPRAVDRLMRHHYPGNVRELENVVKRMIVLDDPELARVAFGPSLRGENGGHGAPIPVAPAVAVATNGAVSLKDIARTAARAAEKDAIARVLEQTGWNRVRAAKLLRISYRALLYKIKHAGLDRRGQARSNGGAA
jgi:two-component system response regulator AtoC